MAVLEKTNDAGFEQLTDIIAKKTAKYVLATLKAGDQLIDLGEDQWLPFSKARTELLHRKSYDYLYYYIINPHKDAVLYTKDNQQGWITPRKGKGTPVKVNVKRCKQWIDQQPDYIWNQPDPRTLKARR